MYCQYYVTVLLNINCGEMDDLQYCSFLLGVLFRTYGKQFSTSFQVLDDPNEDHLYMGIYTQAHIHSKQFKAVFVISNLNYCLLQSLSW